MYCMFFLIKLEIYSATFLAKYIILDILWKYSVRYFAELYSVRYFVEIYMYMYSVRYFAELYSARFTKSLIVSMATAVNVQFIKGYSDIIGSQIDSFFIILCHYHYQYIAFKTCVFSWQIAQTNGIWFGTLKNRFEDSNGVIRSRKSNTNRQIKKYKRWSAKHSTEN